MNTTDITPIEPGATSEFYETKAAELFATLRAGDPESVKRARQYVGHTDLFDAIPQEYVMNDVRLAIAMDHGFISWEKFVYHLNALHDSDSIVFKFEAAVDAIVAGEKEKLILLLNENPELVQVRSSRGHNATLLHYIAANGVENFRQKSPSNAAEIAGILLRTGAVPDALADIYDGKWGTTMGLLVSSYHPSKAGVQSQLVEKLLDYGAEINGVHQDGAPLITALSFHYPEAAETLAANGAGITNIVAAAGLGRTELLETFFEQEGKLKTDMPLLDISWLKTDKTPQANLELAFVWAAMHNRRPSVELLLKKGVKPGVRDFRNWTALHWAAYYGYLEIVKLLLEWNAPLEGRNEFEGTVLDQVLWATANEPFREIHLEIIERLCNAGAQIQSGWLIHDQEPALDDRVKMILEKYKK